MSYEEERSSQIQNQWREIKNRFIDLSLEYFCFLFSNLIVKNPPLEIKYFLSLKLIEFGLELLGQN